MSGSRGRKFRGGQRTALVAARAAEAHYLSTPAVARSAADVPETSPIGVVLSPRHLISVRFAELTAFHTAGQRLRSCTCSAGAFVSLFEAIVDRLAEDLESRLKTLHQDSASLFLAVITLWALKWLDMRIPREHRAQLVIKADPVSFSPSHLADLIAPSGYKAQLRRQTQSEDATQVRLWFDICWRQPEVVGPTLDLPKLVNEHYPVLSFMITSEAGN